MPIEKIDQKVLHSDVEEIETIPSDDVFDFTREDIKSAVPEEVEGSALTIRMWVLSFVFGSVVAGVDSFFSLRYPTIQIGAIVIQVLSFPVGKVLGLLTPKHPFNQKEHAAVYMFANVILSAGLVNNGVIEQFKFFNDNIGISRMILYHIGLYLMGFGVTCIAYDVLVAPESCVWPGVLGTCALFKALFDTRNYRHFKFFGWAMLGSFLWYWFPDFILPFLSTIGAWISWCKPSSPALAQVFGVQTGLGLFPLTFDWAQIASLTNPLLTPAWSIFAVFISFVFWIWIVLPGLYYTNKWQTAHFPIMSNSLFDKHKKIYKGTKVVDKNWKLDIDKFEKYSPVFLPIAFLMNLALGLATFSAVVISFMANFKADVLNHKFTISYWTFIGIFFWAAGLGMDIGFCEGWNVSIKADGMVVAAVLGTVLFLPVAMVEAKANIVLVMQPIFNLISAFWFVGEPQTLLYFYTTGFATLQHAMHMCQSAKVGVYMKLKKHEILIVLCVAGIWAGVVSPAVVGYVLNHVEDACQLDAKNNMTCRKVRTQYNTHLVWGLFGKHLFAVGGRYSWVLYFFLVGAVFSLAIHVLQRFNKNGFIQKIQPSLFFGGAAQIPSVTGFNYSTWALVGLTFNFFIHKKYPGWWREYNLLLGIALACGPAIAAIIIYFSVVYTGASANYNWWATQVASIGCDKKGCPHLTGNLTTHGITW